MTRMVSWGLHLEQPFPEVVGSAVDTALPCDVWSMCSELENGSCNWEPGCWITSQDAGLQVPHPGTPAGYTNRLPSLGL